MKSLIDKNKKISKQRQEFVEHNFEAMVGARKRRYNDTQAQKQRTEFFEDYYLLYTRNKQELDQQKEMWNELKEWLREIKTSSEKQMKEARIDTDYYTRASVQNLAIERVLKQMLKLEGEDE